MDMDERWAMYEALRGQVPAWHPVGVVIEADGPVVRRHYGTHGTVGHAPLAPGTDVAALVRRQQDAFAERCEPVEWKVYGHDSPELGPALTAAGFTPGRQRLYWSPPRCLASGPPPRRSRGRGCTTCTGCRVRPNGPGTSQWPRPAPTRCPTPR